MSFKVLFYKGNIFIDSPGEPRLCCPFFYHKNHLVMGETRIIVMFLSVFKHMKKAPIDQGGFGAVSHDFDPPN